MKLIVEKNVPTDPAKWSYYKDQAKKKFDVTPVHMLMVGLRNNTKRPVVVGKPKNL